MALEENGNEGKNHLIDSFKNPVSEDEPVENVKLLMKNEELEKEMSIVVENNDDQSFCESTVKHKKKNSGLMDIDDMVFGKISGIVKKRVN